jgi:hypothetical protein
VNASARELGRLEAELDALADVDAAVSVEVEFNFYSNTSKRRVSESIRSRRGL